jgi:hypothetical protein
MARLFGQLFQIESLGPAFSLAEGMDVIHVSHDRAGSFGKCRRLKASQKISVFKSPIDICSYRLR